MYIVCMCVYVYVCMYYMYVLVYVCMCVFKCLTLHSAWLLNSEMATCLVYVSQCVRMCAHTWVGLSVS